MNKKAKRVPYEENKHLFVKVAFDVFRFTETPFESYWILEKDSDGKEYLVATYEYGGNEKIESKASTKWDAMTDKKSENVILYYGEIPIKSFASKDYKFDRSNAYVFKQALVEKLSTDKNFVNLLMKEIPEEKYSALAKMFPELTVTKE